jgi:hypothetical protein
MFIQTLLPPVAGGTFRFSVAGCSGSTKIKVLVNSKQILNRKYDGMRCQSMAEIPHGAEGKTLGIYAIDSAGQHKSIEYEISEEDPGAHSMLSKTR